MGEQIRGLAIRNSALVELLKDARLHVASAAGAARLFDGFAPHVENATDCLLARLDVELCRYETRIMSHAEWRALHPTEHPLWCLHAMTGKLEPCDCDLAYPESMQPQSETGED